MDNLEIKNNIGLENFKKLIQEIKYIAISALDGQQTLGRLSQNEIHDAILVSLNNALSDANKKIKTDNAMFNVRKISNIAAGNGTIIINKIKTSMTIIKISELLAIFFNVG